MWVLPHYRWISNNNDQCFCPRHRDVDTFLGSDKTNTSRAPDQRYDDDHPLLALKQFD